jgi:hypothetical protein
MIVAEAFERVVGVDTHAHTHTYCVIDAHTGAVVAGATFPKRQPGTRQGAVLDSPTVPDHECFGRGRGH